MVDCPQAYIFTWMSVIIFLYSDFNKLAMCWNSISHFLSIMLIVLPLWKEHSTYFILIKVCQFVGKLKHDLLFFKTELELLTKFGNDLFLHQESKCLSCHMWEIISTIPVLRSPHSSKLILETPLTHCKSLTVFQNLPLFHSISSFNWLSSRNAHLKMCWQRSHPKTSLKTTKPWRFKYTIDWPHDFVQSTRCEYTVTLS